MSPSRHSSAWQGEHRRVGFTAIALGDTVTEFGQNEDPASIIAFWEGVVDVPLEELDLPELGLRVLISWKAGVEIMTPAYEQGEMAEAARRILDDRGEGVYCSGPSGTPTRSASSP